jgi:predicted naringenin-chalcone synthase
MSKIVAIGTAVPKYKTTQNNILKYMEAAYDSPIAERKLRMLFNHSGIAKRYSVLNDFDKLSGSTSFFNNNNTQANVAARMQAYNQYALPLAIDAINGALNDSINSDVITHIITVSCTGLSAPGLDTEIIDHYKLPKDIFRAAVNFMGCNAAFQALKIADLIIKSNQRATVLVVCVELCTLHFQPKNNNDNLLSNTIFGDGAAALIIKSGNIGTNDLKGISILNFYSVLLSKGKNLMGWNINPINFEMILSAQIPDFIGEELNEILLKAFSKFAIKANEVNHWAVHPGGKKILDVIKQQLATNVLHASYKVLNDYGNMSSPTILFVLKEMLDNNYQKNANIFAIGFGPGLSIETALFQFS